MITLSLFNEIKRYYRTALMTNENSIARYWHNSYILRFVLKDLNLSFKEWKYNLTRNSLNKEIRNENIQINSFIK